MKSKLLKFEVFSTILIFILGVLLHFVYKWSNYNYLVGFFSAVNESTWEHLKLVFYPSIITTFIGYSLFKNQYDNYLIAKTKGILLSMAFIIVFFYTYTGIIGTNYAIIDIGSFFVAILLKEFYEFKKINSYDKNNSFISFVILAILLFCFIIFTIYPPHLNLFKDPIDNTYGINKTSN